MDIKGISETTVLWVVQYRSPAAPQWKSSAGYVSEESASADFSARLSKRPGLERRIVKVTVEEVPPSAQRVALSSQS